MFDYSEKPLVPPVVPPTTPEHLFPSLDGMNVGSATDLTGLMYLPPKNENEYEAYLDLSDGVGVVEDEEDEEETIRNWSEFD